MPKPVPVPRPASLRPATPVVPPVYHPRAALPVQAKLAPSPPRPQPSVPQAFKPQARAAAVPLPAGPSVMIQRAENVPKSIGYSSIALHYSAEQIALAAQQTGHDTGYTGHQSGGPGDGMNSGTVKANKDIVEQLKKNVAKEKRDKKKGPVKQESAKSARWRAINKGKLLMTDALKPNSIGWGRFPGERGARLPALPHHTHAARHAARRPVDPRRCRGLHRLLGSNAGSRTGHGVRQVNPSCNPLAAHSIRLAV